MEHKKLKAQRKQQRNLILRMFILRCPKIHVAFKLLYLGWNYQGYACQEDSPETVEHHLIKALLKCQLIQSRDTSNYHRCGRTDKGVSAFDQVVSITVRAAEEGKPPINYCKILNRLLPENIRIISWAPVHSEFSARFSCNKRMYRYYFPKSNLDLKKMNEAAQHLVGVHDFRNLCKMDVANGVTNFIRSIEKATVSEINDRSGYFNGYEMCQLELIGKAYLWHQVRCIMAVLLLVGRGLEEPRIIAELLDTDKNTRKPQYALANPIGLNLYKCYFDEVDWTIDPEELTNVVGCLQRLWTEHKIKATQIESMITDLEKFVPEQIFEQNAIIVKRESRQYKQLLDRHKCNSLEDRIEHYVKKRKLDIKKKNKHTKCSCFLGF
ncbi:tRNA pseudouridine(38/39) synthase isoform X2 [Cimex lectularius]|uniref:Pseudouridine synthase I TruA alpha/beta domain-containing protein n=1 Tax=Cimex lectularius TaxID=79782 RepID=A0A8I6TEF0_CIMLE|nr:tRNA pseudouridine(38/39) synthase isoform X2 [Cimex lectularius]